MVARLCTVSLVWLALSVASFSAHAQISTSSTGTGNRLGSGSSLSTDITNGGDLFVTNDIELGGQLYVNRQIFMERNASATLEGDQTFFFFEDGTCGGERFEWVNSLDLFSLTDDLRIEGKLLTVGDVFLESTGDFHHYDGFDNEVDGPFYVWRGVTSDDQITGLMILGGPSGSLTLRGTLAQNGLPDLAEGFWKSEPLAPGEVVALDPEHPGAVRKARGAGDPKLLGVVSEAPGMLLAGPSFTAEDLEATWGPDIAEEYHQARERLVQTAVDANPALQARAARLVSPEAFAAHRRDLESPPFGLLLNEDSTEPTPLAPRVRDEIVAEHARARRDLDAHLEFLALSAFFEERMAKVALAGRVPVKVDASYGSVEPGDPLTASPEPGIAMRATAPGPILGTALEGLAEGRGRVLTFVHRGWSAGRPAREARQPLEPRSEAGSTRAWATEKALGNDPSPIAPGAGPVPRTLRTASPGLAEYHPVSEPIRPGEVVVAHRELPGALRAGHRDADRAVVGIAAGEPGVVLGERVQTVVEAMPELGQALEEARSAGDTEEERRLWQRLRERFSSVHAPVALAGTVRAKVDAEWGSIEVGDLLVTSLTRGHLRAEDDPGPGTVVAKALEPLDGGTGEIRVLLMLR